MISAASFTAVWSFHKTNMALGFSANSGRSARGVPLSSVKAGVLPVVSNAIPTTCCGGESFAYRRFQYFDIIEGMLTVTVGGRIAIFTLFPARIVFDRRGYLPARRGIDDNSPRRVAAVVESYDVFVHGCSFLAKGLIEHIVNLVEP